MEEKKYLKWYNKVGYGSGDIAGNVVYAFLTSFVMVYLTDTVRLTAGIVGTLIAVSKIFDGFTDIFFGSMIDKTHTRLGKARPVDDLWIYRLRRDTDRRVCSADESWQFRKVCVVFYRLYVVERCFLYGE